ncbi:MAG TPA: polysaccharide lyase family 7 protein [Devosiaceae bacterium]|jgi:hypothetical protein
MKAIDLSRWELLLPSTPTDLNYLLSGADIGGGSLAGAAENVRFESDGALTFIVPASETAQGPDDMLACELREFDDRVGAHGWNTSQGGYLSASLRINELPEARIGGEARIAIGRIMGSTGQMCVLYYDAGTLYITDSMDRRDGKPLRLDLRSVSGEATAIPLGERFDYFLKVSMSDFVVSVIHHGVTYSARQELNDDWLGKVLHFNVGIGVLPGEVRGAASASYYAISEPMVALARNADFGGALDDRNIVSAKVVLTLDDGGEVEIPLDWRASIRH